MTDTTNAANSSPITAGDAANTKREPLTQQICPACSGSGQIATGCDEWSSTICKTCDGTGLAAPQPQGGALTVPQVEMLRALLVAIRPRFGAVGSRDEDVAAIQRRVDSALAILAAAPPAPQQALQLPVELRAVAETVANSKGFWTSCTGCYDTEDGRPTQKYAHSDVFGCELGNGCSECGGLGAVWDDTDYAEMAEFMAKRDPAPQQAGDGLADEQIFDMADRFARNTFWEDEELKEVTFTPQGLTRFARAAILAAPRQPATFDAEALIRACVPGGSICDPQQVADAIRAYAAPRQPGEVGAGVQCRTCNDNGMIGGPSYYRPDDGGDPCPDCSCFLCNGSGVVPDGEITGEGGVEFSNGPIACVKDCPVCTNDSRPAASAQQDEREALAEFDALIDVYQCAQKDGTFDQRVEARAALKAAFKNVRAAQQVQYAKTPDAPYATLQVQADAGAVARAWINYPVIVKDGEMAAHGKPELSFKRESYGYDWHKAEALYTRPAGESDKMDAGTVTLTRPDVISLLSLIENHPTECAKFIRAAMSREQSQEKGGE